MTAGTHECPAPGCDQQITAERLACPRDWYRLPFELRSRIWRAYRKREADPDTHRAVIAEAVEWFEANA